MNKTPPTMRIPRPNAFTAAVTAIAFAALVSISASHLHIGADADEACAVCAAFAGKLEGPSCKVAVPQPVVVAHLRYDAPSAPPMARSFPVVLPPSCGPPHVA